MPVHAAGSGDTAPRRGSLEREPRFRLWGAFRPACQRLAGVPETKPPPAPAAQGHAVSFDGLPHAERFASLLARREALIADGATGTNLFERGLETGDAPELWNLDRSDLILDHHRAMIDAGADILLTNSFGGNRLRLALHGAAARAGEINRAAARLARRAADAAGRPVLVAGSMGPTGALMAPLGPLTWREAFEVFDQQAADLAAGGADIVWIETMSSKEEAAAAIQGAARGTLRQTGTAALPLVCTMTFDTNGRTMMGVTPQEAAVFFAANRPPLAACGANCGNGFGELVAAVAAMAAAGDGPVLVAKANCGVPYYTEGGIRYSGTPQAMQTYGRLARDAGARIVGGCCGATPGHIAALAAALADHRPRDRPSLEEIEAALGLARAAAARGEGRPRHRRRRDGRR